jgi:ATP-dependent helicase/nuclease subunit A
VTRSSRSTASAAPNRASSIAPPIFLPPDYGARQLANDTTRRNAPRLVEVVNRVFADEPQFPHFRPHRSAETELPGRVELLPLCARTETEGAGPARMRDPLIEPQAVEEDGRRREEAANLAARIGDIVGRWAVIDKRQRRPASGAPRRHHGADAPAKRPARVRAGAALAGIPYQSVGRGGLLHTLEAADLTALLRCLVTPADDLALAHALRTPLLGADDADLLHLAGRDEPVWWLRLQASAAAGLASPALARAARLLAEWRAAAARLPVHDLLDRIYHQGELTTRYRAAVPAALWPGVAANLEAFMALALRLDAGRYPSLPRFLDELARLGEAGDEEAPDEGAILAEEAGDRVRLLTIHGAKGLEAPVVWLIDANNTHQPAEAWTLLLDWPPQAAQPAHFSVLGRKDECGPRRAGLIEAEMAQAAREELNLLYVAMTRARQYFFASGIASERGRGRISYWERLDAALAALGGAAGIHGEAPQPADSLPPPPAARARVAVRPAEACPAIGQRREAASAGMDHGRQLHAALDWLSAGGTAERPPPGIPAPLWPDLRATARRLLEAPELRRFFDPAQYLRALNEVEFALPDGRVGRIDRLVETAEGWWVLDYKSGRPDAELLSGYRSQLEGYRAALTSLFHDTPVRCGLVFSDCSWLEI